MSFPFSIIGTLIYIFYVAAIIGIVAIPLYLFVFKNNRWKWFFISPIVILLVLAPVAEEVYIQHRFETLCEDAGVHVKRKVKAEGFFDATQNDSSTTNKVYDDPRAVKRIKDSGFRFKERRTSQEKVRHLEIKNGKIEQTIIDKPEAQYYYKYSHNNNRVDWKITKSQRIVEDSTNNGDIIGRATTIKRYPCFIESIWIRFFGSGMQMCPVPDEPPYQPPFPESVLNPIKH